ncbi:MAG: DUF2059 domain-containing protein, partial [Alistipes sp.]|nr:DUF2059 domain-containing protein [Alistipes sp.]
RRSSDLGLLEESFTELMELMVPIYAQFYTEKDMDELIAFYESPIGRKLAASQPQITQQTMLSLQGWTAQFAQKLAALLGTQATDSSASESEQ